MNRRLKIIIISVIVFILMLFFAVLAIVNSSNNDQIDRLPIEGADSENTGKVIFTDGRDLIRQLGGVASYDYVRSDLYIFGKIAYEKYSTDSDAIIGFEISNLAKNDNIVTFDGRFGASKNNVEVVVTLLNKDKLGLNITDTVTQLNIDEFLPSNSQRNMFIGTLPIEESNYVIDYLELSDSFTINVFNNSSNYQLALEVLEKGLGETFKDEVITRYGVGDFEFDNGF